MVFQSVEFVLFFVLVFICYWKISSKYRWGVLLAAGYTFYASWDIRYVLLLLSVTVISFWAALAIDKLALPQKKYVLAIYIVLELGLLGYYKYIGFFSELLNDVLWKMMISIQIPVMNILLPVGISFYVFQTMGYVFDVYYGGTMPEKHFGYLAASIAFFPILLSGPIEKCQNLISQFREEKAFSYEEGVYAIQRILMGCLKKIIIADSLAVYVNRVYSDVYSYSGFDLLTAIVIYSIEIYCDFSGYSDIATGVAGLLGIKLRQNFLRPYFADSMKEFWKRWHISLTSWFREYVYIPLGGNRVETWKINRNVMVTFLLSGLWHGASWTFIVWGVVHGWIQVIEGEFARFWKKSWSPGFLKQLTVFGFVSIDWVFFRADNLSEAGYILTHCLQGITSLKEYFRLNNGLMEMEILQMGLLFLFMVVIFVIELREERGKPLRAGILPTAFLIAVVLFYYFRYSTDSSAFIYFQF